MGAINLNKEDQRVLLDALERLICAYGEDGDPSLMRDKERAERLARSLNRFPLEDIPT